MKTFKARPLLSDVGQCFPGACWYLSDMHPRFSFGEPPCCFAPLPDSSLLPPLTLFSPPTQGFVLDIYYQGTEAEIQQCARPDGRVPLVWLWHGWGALGTSWEKREGLPFAQGRVPLLLEDFGVGQDQNLRWSGTGIQRSRCARI